MYLLNINETAFIHAYYLFKEADDDRNETYRWLTGKF